MGRRAASLAPRVTRAGCVFVNGGGFDFNAPFGGYKQSGNGREYAEWGLREFLEVKSIYGDNAA